MADVMDVPNFVKVSVVGGSVLTLSFLNSWWAFATIRRLS